MMQGVNQHQPSYPLPDSSWHSIVFILCLEINLPGYLSIDLNAQHRTIVIEYPKIVYGGASNSISFALDKEG